MTEYVLVGGGGFAREVHDWFAPSLAAGGDRFLGYLDDGEQPMRAAGQPLAQIGSIAAYRPDPAHRLVMAIGAPAAKAAVARRLIDAGGIFASLLHPSAWIAASARLGEGVIVGVSATISANATLGDFTTVNSHASVGHDAVLGDYATLAGYVDLTGFVRVGEMASLGSGARILPRLSIGARCTIGAGAVVVRSVPDDVTLYAAPARRL